MTDVLVLTRSSNRAASAPFEKSAGRWKVPVTMLESQEANSQIGEGWLQGIAAISNSSASWIVVTDAFDVLVARWDRAELIARLEAAHGNIIVSCEKNCWPDGEWCARYPITASPWKFICGGQYAGRRAELLAMLKEMYERRETVTAGGSTQEILHKMFVGGWPMTLDRECSIFQSMLGANDGEIVPRGGGAFNAVTLTAPMFLHFNGHADGFKEWEGLLR